jgi:hypothetical protein
MLLDIVWVIAVSVAIAVFFVFYLAFAYLLLSPLFEYRIERTFRGAWASKASSLSGRTRAWLKLKHPNFQRS